LSSLATPGRKIRTKRDQRDGHVPVLLDPGRRCRTGGKRDRTQQMHTAAALGHRLQTSQAKMKRDGTLSRLHKTLTILPPISLSLSMF